MARVGARGRSVTAVASDDAAVETHAAAARRRAHGGRRAVRGLGDNERGGGGAAARRELSVTPAPTVQQRGFGSELEFARGARAAHPTEECAKVCRGAPAVDDVIRCRLPVFCFFDAIVVPSACRRACSARLVGNKLKPLGREVRDKSQTRRDGEIRSSAQRVPALANECENAARRQALGSVGEDQRECGIARHQPHNRIR